MTDPTAALVERAQVIKECCDCAEGQRGGTHDPDCGTRSRAFALLLDRHDGLAIALQRSRAEVAAERTARQQAERERDFHSEAAEKAQEMLYLILRGAGPTDAELLSETIVAIVTKRLATLTALRSQVEALRVEMETMAGVWRDSIKGMRLMADDSKLPRTHALNAKKAAHVVETCLHQLEPIVRRLAALTEQP